MPDYGKLYSLLFNAVTDALDEIERMNFGQAKAVLVAAQQMAEEVYISDGDAPEAT